MTNYTAQGHITVTRQRDGKDGEDSVRRYLVVSPTSLVANSGRTDFVGGKIIHCEVWKQEGQNNPTQQGLSDISVEVYKDTGITPILVKTAVSFDFTTAVADAKTYTFQLKYGNAYVDVVSVSVTAEGEKGRGITSANTFYALSADSAKVPADTDFKYDTMSSVVISSNKDKYLWSADKVIYTDNTAEFTGHYLVGKCSELASVTEQYATTTAISEPTAESDWSDKYPTNLTQGTYIWSRDKMLWKDGNVTYSSAQLIGRISVDGKNSVRIDLDNEMDVIPCDSDGKTTAKVTIITHVRLYDGTSVVSDIDIPSASALKIEDVLPTVTPSNGVIEVKWEIAKGKVLSSDKYAVTIPITYNSNTYTAVFTAGVQKSGKSGVSPAVYQLLPSQTDVSFSRGSNNELSPAYIDITCGYTKTYEGKVETYPGTDVRNTWYGGGTGAPYNILFRGINADGTYSSWGWIKDVQVSGVYGVLRIQRDVTFVGYEFILTSAGSITDITDSKIIDRETLPINKDGLNGTNGEDGADGKDGEDGNGIKSMSSLFVASTKSSGVTYDNTIGWQNVFVKPTADLPYVWKCVKTEYTQASASYSTAELIAVYQSGANPNLLDNAAFVSMDKMSAWDTINQPSMQSGYSYDENNIDGILTGQGGYQGRNAFRGSTHYSLTYLKYKNILQQPIKAKIKPSTWYTLSFWSRALSNSLFYGDNGEMTSNLNDFGRYSLYLKQGQTYYWQINGFVSSAAQTAGRKLRAYIYKRANNGDWLWNTYLEIDKTTPGYKTATFTIPRKNSSGDIIESGEFILQFSCFSASGGNGTASQTVTATRVYIRSVTEMFASYVYPSTIDPNVKMFIDDVEDTRSNITDGYAPFGQGDWKFHTVRFKTKASLPDVEQYVLFRMMPSLVTRQVTDKYGNNVTDDNQNFGITYIDICMPKLEEGMLATGFLDTYNDLEGPRGRSYNPVINSVYDPNKQYVWNDEQRDYVYNLVSGSFEMWGVKTYGTTVPVNTPPPSDSTGTASEYWVHITNYKTLLGECIFGNNAVIGGFTTTSQIFKSLNGLLELNGKNGTIQLRHKDSAGNVEYEWNVGEDGVQTMGTPDGQRIELNPSQRSMNIYDQDGQQSAVFEGNSYGSIGSLFGNTSGSLTYRTRTSEEAGYISGVTMARGTLNKNTEDTAAPRSGSSVFQLTEGFSAAPIDVSIASGTLYTRVHSGEDYTNIPAKATVLIQLRVATYTDSTKGKLIGTVSVKSCSSAVYSAGRSGNHSESISNISVRTASGGFHVLELYYSWSICGSGSTIFAHWGSTSSEFDSSGIAVPTYASNFYVSRYFANGFCLGINQKNYFWIRNNNGNMVFEGIVGNYGLKVDKDGVMMKHHNGNYQMIPQIILWGYVTIADSTTTPVKASLKTFDGSKFSTTATAVTSTVGMVRRMDTGQLRILFPSGWHDMNLSDSNSFVTITGYRSSLKGTLNDFNQKYIDVFISDDDTLNDGTIFIKVEKMM